MGDNTFSPFVDRLNWWSADGIFEITIGFGSMSFAQAKIVDIIWDVVSSPLASCITQGDRKTDNKGVPILPSSSVG